MRRRPIQDEDILGCGRYQEIGLKRSPLVIGRLELLPTHSKTFCWMEGQVCEKATEDLQNLFCFYVSILYVCLIAIHLVSLF